MTLKKQIIKRMITLFTVVMLMFTGAFSYIGCPVRSVYSKSGVVKEIKLCKGSVYRLGHKKGYSYKCNKPGVISITKKGIVRTKKCGRCMVYVYGKKSLIKKIKLVVTDKHSGNGGNGTATGQNGMASSMPPSPSMEPSASPLPSATPTAVPREPAPAYTSKLIIDRIVLKDDNISYVYFSLRPGEECGCLGDFGKDENDIMMIEVHNLNTDIYGIGDCVWVCIAGRYSMEYKDGIYCVTLYDTGVRLDKIYDGNDLPNSGLAPTASPIG